MADRFDIQRGMDNAGGEITRRSRARLDEERELERARRGRMVKLSSGYFFDPVDKVLLKKSGSQLGFVRHDRRYARAVKASQAEAEARGFRLVAGGLFWDEKAKKLYRKSGKQYLLYTSDRRKAGAKASPAVERRSKR